MYIQIGMVQIVQKMWMSAPGSSHVKMEDYVIITTTATPVTVTTQALKVREHVLYWGSYSSGHFVWNLWNEPLVSFIKFIWKDHKFKILFITWPFKIWLYRFQNENYFSKKMHCWHGHCQWRYAFAPKCYYTCVHTIFMTWHYPLINSDLMW